MFNMRIYGNRSFAIDINGRDPDFGYGRGGEHSGSINPKAGERVVDLLDRTVSYCEAFLKNETGSDFNVKITYLPDVRLAVNNLCFYANEVNTHKVYIIKEPCASKDTFDTALQKHGRNSLYRLVRQIKNLDTEEPTIEEPAKEVEAESVKLVSYTCASCGSPLTNIDSNKLVCPHCGREYYKRVRVQGVKNSPLFYFLLNS